MASQKNEKEISVRIELIDSQNPQNEAILQASREEQFRLLTLSSWPSREERESTIDV